MGMKLISYRRHRFPPIIIQHAVWLCFRFSLSYRDIEDLLAEQIAQMEAEMAKLQRGIKLIEGSYGPDHLNLVLARGYLVTLLENEWVTHFLAGHHADILREFRRISEVASIGPEERM